MASCTYLKHMCSAPGLVSLSGIAVLYVLYVPMARTDSHRSSVSSQPPSHPFDPFPSTLVASQMPIYCVSGLQCLEHRLSKYNVLLLQQLGAAKYMRSTHVITCTRALDRTAIHTGSCTSRVYDLLRGANKAAAPFPNASAELPNMLCSWPACLQRSKVANHRFLIVRGSTLELPVS